MEMFNLVLFELQSTAIIFKKVWIPIKDISFIYKTNYSYEKYIKYALYIINKDNMDVKNKKIMARISIDSLTCPKNIEFMLVFNNVGKLEKVHTRKTYYKEYNVEELLGDA